jgi:hypothetical protein
MRLRKILKKPSHAPACFTKVYRGCRDVLDATEPSNILSRGGVVCLDMPFAYPAMIALAIYAAGNTTRPVYLTTSSYRLDMKAVCDMFIREEAVPLATGAPNYGVYLIRPEDLFVKDEAVHRPDWLQSDAIVIVSQPRHARKLAELQRNESSMSFVILGNPIVMAAKKTNEQIFGYFS